MELSQRVGIAYHQFSLDPLMHYHNRHVYVLHTYFYAIRLAENLIKSNRESLLLLIKFSANLIAILDIHGYAETSQLGSCYFYLPKYKSVQRKNNAVEMGRLTLKIASRIFSLYI